MLYMNDTFKKCLPAEHTEQTHKCQVDLHKSTVQLDTNNKSQYDYVLAILTTLHYSRLHCIISITHCFSIYLEGPCWHGWRRADSLRLRCGAWAANLRSESWRNRWCWRPGRSWLTCVTRAGRVQVFMRSPLRPPHPC